MCLDYVDQLDRTYLWNVFESLYLLTDIADEMIAFAPDVFLRAGLLQHPEMALTLLEAGAYHLIPPSTMYPDYVFSVNDVFNGIENYYPFGSVYLQNVKNTLMNSGHAAPGWTYSVAEHHIYGSSRLGVHNTNKLIASRENQNPIVYTSTNTEYTTLNRGKRHYELSNHLGNVQVVISDKRVSVCDEYLGVDRFEAEVLSAMDYYPFGMLIPDRQWYANSDSSNYRYGMNGQEKVDEISGSGNHYTAEYWEMDPRLGRRWNQDPKPHPSISNYAVFANNPIFYSDVLGDTVRGVNATSGTRMRDAIHNSFKGDDAAALRNLFKLGADGKTMASINESDFVNAVSGLTSDQQQLAYGYYNAINSTDVHTVEMVYRNEALSATTKGITGKSTGAELDDMAYGGFNVKTSSNSTFSAIVMDNAKHVGDYIDNKGASSFRAGSPGEILAHEMLGHGVGALRGSATSGHQDALQMSNLYLRAQGQGYYRNGAWHGTNVVLSKSTANQVPSFIQLPASIQSAINTRKFMIEITKPLIMERDNTYVKPPVILR